jgi:hypothetical protein
MRKSLNTLLASSLVFFALACGKPAGPGPAPEQPAPAVKAGTGRVTLHVKGMTKALNLF